MHYTSWDRSDRAKPVLLAEEGPEHLGVFSEHSAEVDGHFWRTEVSDLGASATLADGAIYRLAGRPGRDKRLEASLNGRTFTFINENSGDWIIDDVDDEKVGQFTARNSGVRKAILEFEHDAEGLTTAEIAGLSWFTRVILDANTQGKAWAWIITLVLASIVALVALFVL